MEWYPGETINFLEEKENILVMVTQTSYKNKLHLVSVIAMFQTMYTCTKTKEFVLLLQKWNSVLSVDASNTGPAIK